MRYAETRETTGGEQEWNSRLRQAVCEHPLAMAAPLTAVVTWLALLLS
jgi:hypothetical protein